MSHHKTRTYTNSPKITHNIALSTIILSLSPLLFLGKSHAMQQEAISVAGDRLEENVRVSRGQNKNTDLLLLKAIQINDQEQATHALENGTDPNGLSDGLCLFLITSLSYNQIPLLSRAVLFKATNVVKCLLEYNADPNIPDEHMRRPLHHIQDVETAQLLLEYKADIHATDRLGQTPLHVLAQNKNDRCVQVLLNANANPCACNPVGKTPLRGNAQDNTNIIAIALANGGAIPLDEGEPCHESLDAEADASEEAMLDAYQQK